MKAVVPLLEARDDGRFGSKAVGLGEAARAGLPLPPGVALAGSIVEAVATGEENAIEEVVTSVRLLDCPLAVRSSAIDEDGAVASFAGQHLTLLNVPSPQELTSALREIWWSANSDSAITYRQRVGLFARPSVGIVVQTLLDPDVAGVMFTTNPITGDDERVVEASWGLGEAVVAGRVIPDHFRVARSGEVLERVPGVKKLAVRTLAEGGTVEEDVPPELVERLCLDDDQLAALSRLADRCEQVYGPARDIEWAFADRQLYLLQCRAVTRAGSEQPSLRPEEASEEGEGHDRAVPGAPVEALHRVPLFADLDEREVAEIARSFKERRFSDGETVIKEGLGGAAFFLIDSGEAKVSVAGKERATLRPGDYFGEIALIDEDARSATLVASGELVCYGITLWEFRPLVHENSAIAWKLLQALAKRLRTAEHYQAPRVCDAMPDARNQATTR